MEFIKNIPNFRKRLLLFILAIFLSITALSIIQHPLLTTYAEEDDGGAGNGDGAGDDTDLNDQENSDYPSYADTGWLVYVVSKDGALSSPVTFVSAGGSVPSSYYAGMLTSRIGGAYPAGYYTGAEWGYPFTDSGAGRGGIIKTELATGRNYDGTQSNAFYVITKYLGVDIFEMVIDKPGDYYLVLETVAWHKIFTGSASGTLAVASSSGWAKLQSLTGIADGGDGHTGWCDNFRLQRSCYLDREWPGLPTVPTYLGLSADEASGRIPHSLINQNIGYGMIAVRLIPDMQTTCDEPNPDPHDPPEESTGEVTIVKSYRDKINGEYSHTATKYRTGTSNNILIENEPEYQVIDWVTSSTTNTSVPGYVWNPPVTGVSQSGKTPTAVTLSQTETCLYVLLERIEEDIPEPVDFNYKLTESQITRRVWFSDPDDELTNMGGTHKINEYKFKWKAAAFEQCPGHDYPNGCEGHNQTHAEVGCTTEGCTSSHERDCGDSWCGDDGTEYCGNNNTWEWEDKLLKVSICNTLKSEYPTILATKDGWNFETEAMQYAKHYYPDSGKYERQTKDEEIFPSSGDDGWDYICVLMRGADKLTVAQWENDGAGKNAANNANEDLVDASPKFTP